MTRDRAVFLDLGNVIVSVNIAMAIAKFAELFDIDAGLLAQARNSQLERDFERGFYSPDEYLEIVRETYGLDRRISLDRLIEIWGHPFELMEGTFALLPVLKKQAGLFLLSNTNAIHIEAIQRKYSFLKMFDGLVLSYEVGIAKPDPGIYQAALRTAGVTAEAAVFVDDLPENVAAAREAGIRSHQYETHTGMIEFLRLNQFDV